MESVGKGATVDAVSAGSVNKSDNGVDLGDKGKGHPAEGNVLVVLDPKRRRTAEENLSTEDMDMNIRPNGMSSEGQISGELGSKNFIKAGSGN
ncbi:conserved hypothetical protein [Ricinus communis]|uniref:Uncharacterized protein n=1 Tax=Ricinus communis TaxID=3988 RepID=B9SBZ6_RICCO|nr:conserved hypothetical protein [Ricinus communis]